ncbi:MAG: DUF1343 domain-containing protein [Elusimicrobia bacterium]|nr:DUF1343 domain-containing protein [Elusimicrobiota bacterium]
MNSEAPASPAARLFGTTLGIVLLVSVLFLQAAAAQSTSTAVSPGVDVLLSERLDLVRGKRVALVTHAAAVTSGLEPTIDALARTPDVTLVALMGPEHGLRGSAYAGERVADERDPKTGLPLYSLYGSLGKPTPEMLQGVDAVVIDFQDIGARSYTYKTTMALAMEAAAEAGIEVIVLDRPDPLGADRVEGNVPPAEYPRSDVCWFRVPYVFGMTSGELAQLINGEGWLAGGVRARLTVVPMKGYRRGMLFSETGLPWVPPSPHIPRWESALFYAATGMFGPPAAGFNNGVGYTLPFELMGATWIDGERLAEKLNALGEPGLRFRPLNFKPFYFPQKGTMCGGVQIHLVDPARAPLFPITFHAFDALRELYPDRELFAEPVRERSLWNRLFGKPPSSAWEDWERGMCDPSVRKQLAAGRTAKEFLAGWEEDVSAFRRLRERYLIYP